MLLIKTEAYRPLRSSCLWRSERAEPADNQIDTEGHVYPKIPDRYNFPIPKSSRKETPSIAFRYHTGSTKPLGTCDARKTSSLEPGEPCYRTLRSSSTGAGKLYTRLHHPQFEPARPLRVAFRLSGSGRQLQGLLPMLGPGHPSPGCGIKRDKG